MSRATSRYLVEVGVGTLVLAVIGECCAESLPLVGDHASWRCALGVVVLATVPVYLMVALGLVKDPARFMLWWGMALLLKFAWYGLASAVLILTGVASFKPYLLDIAIMFPVFTAHQVVRLVRLADAHGRRAELQRN